MDESKLAEQAQACQQLGCGQLLPSQCVKLIRRFLPAERAGARQRQLAGSPLGENVPKGQRAPTTWERIGAKLGLSGRTTRKIWEVQQAIDKDPRLAWMMEEADKRGIDGPYTKLRRMRAGRPVQEWDGRLLPMTTLHPDYGDAEELWYLQAKLERVADEMQWLLRRHSPEEHVVLLCDLLGRLFRMLWVEREHLTPERLQATFAQFLARQQADPQPWPRPTLTHRMEGPGGGLQISWGAVPWGDWRKGLQSLGTIGDLELLRDAPLPLARGVARVVRDLERTGHAIGQDGGLRGQPRGRRSIVEE